MKNKKPFCPDLSEVKVFITGSTGFLGSHLLKRLIKRGFDLNISIRKNSSLCRINDVIDDCTYHIVDLTEFSNVKSLIREIKPNIIFHLATYGADYRQQNVFEAININVNSSINLLKTFFENGGSRFIYTGTSLEYGSKDNPISEEDIPNPRSLYGITKFTCTKILSLMMSKQTHQGDLVILRPFSIFGEFESDHRFFPFLIDNLSKRKPVKMTAGRNKRDYLYVQNFVDACMKVIHVPLENPFEIINIASGNGISLKDIALIIAEELGVSNELLKIGALPYRSDELMKSVGNIEKAKNLLDWKPTVSLKEGIRKTIESRVKR